MGMARQHTTPHLPLYSRMAAWTPDVQEQCLSLLEAGDYRLLGQLFDVLYHAVGQCAQLLRVLASPAAWALEAQGDGAARFELERIHAVAVGAFESDLGSALDNLLRWAAQLLVCGRVVSWVGWRVVGGHLRPYVQVWPIEFVRELVLLGSNRCEVMVGPSIGQWVPVSEPYQGGRWWVVDLGPSAWRHGMWRSLSAVPYRSSVIWHYGSEAVRTGSGVRHHIHDDRPLLPDEMGATAEVAGAVESGDAVVTSRGQTLEQLQPSSGGAQIIEMADRHLREQLQLTILGRVLTGAEAVGLGQGDSRTQALKMLEAGVLTRVAVALSDALYGPCSPVAEWWALTHADQPMPECRISTAEAEQVETPSSVLALLTGAVQAVGASNGVLQLEHVLRQLELERFLTPGRQ